MTDLLPCPFCAGVTPDPRWGCNAQPRVEKDSLGFWHARCPACGATFMMRTSEQQARRDWNRRVTVSAPVST